MQCKRSPILTHTRWLKWERLSSIKMMPQKMVISRLCCRGRVFNDYAGYHLKSFSNNYCTKLNKMDTLRLINLYPSESDYAEAKEESIYFILCWSFYIFQLFFSISHSFTRVFIEIRFSDNAIYMMQDARTAEERNWRSVWIFSITLAETQTTLTPIYIYSFS